MNAKPASSNSVVMDSKRRSLLTALVDVKIGGSIPVITAPDSALKKDSNEKELLVGHATIRGA